MGHPQTITERIAFHAADRPDHPAIISGDRVVSYRLLHRKSNRTAHALLGLGVRRGSRVAFLGRESEHYYDIVLGTIKTGAVMVPINWRLTTREVDHVLRDSGAEVIFVEAEFAPLVERVRAELPGLHTVIAIDAPDGRGTGFLAWKSAAEDTDIETGTDRDDPIVQMYTSGTTGLPKGVVLAHRTYFTYAESMTAAGLDWIDWLAEDRALISFPGLHSAGMAWFMFGLVAGSTSVIMRMFDPEEAVRLIRAHKITNTFAAPSMLLMMLDEAGPGSDAFASMRKIVYGGAPMAEHMMRRCVEGFGCDLAQMYASAETGSVITCLPAAEHLPGTRHATSAGRACPGNEVRILGPEGVLLPAGEIGQICVRSPATMVGYWRNPEATSAVLDADGWLRMPDAGYLDEDGYLFVCDRINDMIIVAGQNIYPVEVEEALCASHPAIAEAAVVGVADPQWGETVRAVIVLRPGQEVSGREIMRSLRGRIADFKIPTRYDFVDELPRNPTGKVLRRELRDPIRS